jgi:hypothetical protein
MFIKNDAQGTCSYIQQQWHIKQREETGSTVAHSIGHELLFKTNEVK